MFAAAATERADGEPAAQNEVRLRPMSDRGNRSTRFMCPTSAPGHDGHPTNVTAPDPGRTGDYALGTAAMENAVDQL